MTYQKILHRIALVRPADAGRTGDLVEPGERGRLFDSITANSVTELDRTARILKRRPVGVVTVLSGVAACGAFVVSGVIPVDGSTGVKPVPVERPVLDVAHVTARTAAAIDGAAQDVVHAKSTPGNGVTFESWTLPDGSKDHSTSLQPNGQPLNDIALVAGKDTMSATVVSYLDQAWWTWSNQVTPDPCQGRPHCSPTTKSPGLMTPSEIRKQVANGGLHLVNPSANVDGRPAVELVGTILNRPFTLWVDASTYLPIRTKITNPVGTIGQSDYAWLEPTADNLAKLQVRIPAGFVRSPTPIVPPLSPNGGQG